MATAKSTLKSLIKMPIEHSIMLISPHGMGKSSIVKQASQFLNIEFHDIRLSQCEVGDIKGLPYLNEESKTTEFFKPKWWPRDPNSSGFLFFDELNRANNEVQQAVFEIILDRRLDGEMLPKGWRVVAAINGDDRYQVSELDPALLDRFFIIDFKPEITEWLDWAESSGIHLSIRQFISANQEFLDPPDDLRQGMVYPSRRSWAKFNEAMNQMNLWENKNEADINHLALGWIGRAAGIRFSTFFIKDFKLVNPEDILNNFDKVLPDLEKMKGDLSAMVTVARSFGKTVQNLGDELTEEQFDNLKKLIRFLPREIASSVWTEIGREKMVRRKTTKLPKEDPEFLRYITRLFSS